MITVQVTPAQFAYFTEAAYSLTTKDAVSKIRGALYFLGVEGCVDGDLAFVLQTIGTPLCPEIRLTVVPN
jgi:hypothetical protein